MQCLALVDTGYSQSIVSADRCTTWSSQHVDMQTIDGESRACCGVATVSILTSGGGQAILNMLVARERPLNYDLLIGIDAIRVLGGIMIMPTREVKLGGEKEVCAALCVDEPDFDASFDHNKKIIVEYKRRFLVIHRSLFFSCVIWRRENNFTKFTLNSNWSFLFMNKISRKGKELSFSSSCVCFMVGFMLFSLLVSFSMLYLFG